MNDVEKVACAYAIEQIRKYIRICEASGFSKKKINLIRMGVAGLIKEYRELVHEEEEEEP